MRRRAVAGAVVVGSAVAANRHSAAPDQAQQQPEPEPEQQQPAADDTVATLTKLAELHASGVLTDEEFAQQKAQILGA